MKRTEPKTLLQAVRAVKTEAQIQDECCRLLDAMGIVYSVTDASRSFGPDGKPRESKVRRGWPDLTACWWTLLGYARRGIFLGIEVKRPGKKQSDDQEECQEEIERSGGIYWLVHSAEELRKRLEGR